MVPLGGLTGLLVVILLQTLMMSFLIVFLVLFSRSQSSFLPVRDCPYFVYGVERIFPVSESSHLPVSRSRAESV